MIIDDLLSECQRTMPGLDWQLGRADPRPGDVWAPIGRAAGNCIKIRPRQPGSSRILARAEVHGKGWFEYGRGCEAAREAVLNVAQFLSLFPPSDRAQAGTALIEILGVAS